MRHWLRCGQRHSGTGCFLSRLALWKADLRRWETRPGISGTRRTVRVGMDDRRILPMFLLRLNQCDGVDAIKYVWRKRGLFLCIDYRQFCSVIRSFGRRDAVQAHMLRPVFFSCGCMSNSSSVKTARLTVKLFAPLNCAKICLPILVCFLWGLDTHGLFIDHSLSNIELSKLFARSQMYSYRPKSKKKLNE